MDKDERRVRPTLHMTRGTAYGNSPFGKEAADKKPVLVRQARSSRTKGPLSSPTGAKSDSRAAAAGEIDITHGPDAKPEITLYSRQVLTDILKKAGLCKAKITRTSVGAPEQARDMFQNLERLGVKHQKALYGAAGDKVIEVYREAKDAGKSAAEIRELMTKEILRVGTSNVTHHAADPTVLNVFDVAPSSITDRPAFEKAVRADKRVDQGKFKKPPKDPAYHFEIPQPDLSKESSATKP